MAEAIPAVILAATPPMRWKSWTMFGGRVTEADVRETADTSARLGRRGLGYAYAVIDDFWSVKDGHDPDGNLVPNPLNFQARIAALAEHVHGLGLKLGISSDPADRTCAGNPGSHECEERDEALWAPGGRHPAVPDARRIVPANRGRRGCAAFSDTDSDGFRSVVGLHPT